MNKTVKPAAIFNARGIPMKRVVIVDDSRSMRLWLRHILDNDTRLHIVGEAANADEARAVIRKTKPDVITLDIEMPGMNGLVFLDHLMRLHPMPVVMVSSATRQGSEAAIQALSAGAVDCLLKPTSPTDERLQRDLVRRVYSAACSQIIATKPKVRPNLPPSDGRATGPQPIILFGASTGGVSALETVLQDLDPAGPPVAIVQHMPGAFLVSFARMLNKTLPQDVRLLRHGEEISPGQVRLAPGLGQHTEIKRVGSRWMGRFSRPDETALHCPSVDALFASVVEDADAVIAAVLTGLGQDGAVTLKALRAAGAHTICQDAATSVVYGMPRTAWETGAAEYQLPLDQIGSAINGEVRRRLSERAGANI